MGLEVRLTKLVNLIDYSGERIFLPPLLEHKAHFDGEMGRKSDAWNLFKDQKLVCQEGSILWENSSTSVLLKVSPVSEDPRCLFVACGILTWDSCARYMVLTWKFQKCQAMKHVWLLARVDEAGELRNSSFCDMWRLYVKFKFGAFVCALIPSYPFLQSYSMEYHFYKLKTYGGPNASGS